MKFQPENLITVRQYLGITKAEAARRLNMSAMGYGRYEKGEREPSFQMVNYIAQTFGTSIEYLYGESDINPANEKRIIITLSENPELYDLVNTIQTNPATYKRLMAYYQKIKSIDSNK